MRKWEMGSLAASLIVGLIFTPTGMRSQTLQKASPSVGTDLFVLRSERVTQWVSSGETARLNCSVVGFGNSAQINCQSSTSTTGLADALKLIPLVYNVALVVGSDVGYLVECGGGLLWRIGCDPLPAGQAIQGTIRRSKLTVTLDGKNKSYSILRSHYIGSIRKEVPELTHRSVQPEPTGRPSSEAANVGVDPPQQRDLDETAGFKNGRWWKGYRMNPETVRLGYLAGVKDGIEVTRGLNDITSDDPFRPDQMTYGEIITALDDFFREPTNADIPITMAMRYIRRKKEGANEAELRELEATLRAGSAELVKP